MNSDSREKNLYKKNFNDEFHTHLKVQPAWQRIILLIILGYEALGCLVGGSFLIVRPNGILMDMPVDIMHGAFLDFLIPGIILFGLGILNSFAFLSVRCRSDFDWIFAGLALGGLFIWFWVEIAILRELHWVHAMWGIPVLLGWVVLMPLIALRNKPEIIRRFYLTCGILSSLWYLIINIIVPMQDLNYNSVTQTVSELSAIGAPTRILWMLLVMIYPLLYAAFGWGVIQVAAGSRLLRVMGVLIIIYGVLNFYWPPMHLREVIAAGGGTLSDTLHITWAMMTIVVNMILLGLGAAALGKGFRLFSIIIFVIFVVFGIFIGKEAPGIQANLPTPGIGVWERINIGAFMFWIVVLAFTLLKRINLK